MSSREYSKNNREKIRKYNKEYRKNNYDRIRERRRMHTEENRERILETSRAYRTNHPEKIAAYRKIRLEEVRLLRKIGVPGSSAELRALLPDIHRAANFAANILGEDS